MNDTLTSCFFSTLAEHQSCAEVQRVHRCARSLRCSFRLISFAQPTAASKRKYLSHFPRLVCPPLARSLASSFKFKMLTRAQHEQHGPPVHKNRSFRAKTTSATAAGVRRLRARCNHYPSLKSSSWIPLHTVLFITVVTKRRPSTAFFREHSPRSISSSVLDSTKSLLIISKTIQTNLPTIPFKQQAQFTQYKPIGVWISARKFNQMERRGTAHQKRKKNRLATKNT